MNNLAKVAIGLAAVLVVAVVGWNLLPGTSGRRGPHRRPRRAPSPSAEPIGRSERPRARRSARWRPAPQARLRDRPWSRSPSPSRMAGAAEGWFLTKSAPRTERPGRT